MGSFPVNKAESVDESSAVPPRLGPYELRAKLADGGMASVFVARRDDGGQPAQLFAIKRIRDDLVRNAEFVTMFVDEAKIASHLRHPNIVRCHELGNEGGHLFLVMELLFGQSLWSLWEACRARRLRLRYDMIAWVGARVADGLHYAHELTSEPRGANAMPLDIVHRDVNATNVFVTYDGQIKLIDFGLAKAANRASKTAAGVIKGKVAYMSPEQALGVPVDRRTDLFALGTMLWELGCDRRLFRHSDDVETLKRIAAAEIPDATRIVPGFPPSLWRVLEKALARDKEDRYSTAAELGRDLDAFVGGAVDSTTVAQVMRELFAQEKAKEAEEIARLSHAPSEPQAALDAVDGTRSRRGWTVTPTMTIALVLAGAVAVAVAVLALR